MTARDADAVLKDMRLKVRARYVCNQLLDRKIHSQIFLHLFTACYVASAQARNTRQRRELHRIPIINHIHETRGVTLVQTASSVKALVSTRDEERGRWVQDADRSLHRRIIERSGEAIGDGRGCAGQTDCTRALAGMA